MHRRSAETTLGTVAFGLHFLSGFFQQTAYGVSTTKLSDGEQLEFPSIMLTKPVPFIIQEYRACFPGDLPEQVDREDEELEGEADEPDQHDEPEEPANGHLLSAFLLSSEGSVFKTGKSNHSS